LLLLAIADDAMGLVVLAVFYPSGALSPLMLAVLLLPGMALAWTMRRFGVENFWAYVLGPGVLSWLGLFHGGLHPALALVPIIPLMPHHQSDLRVIGRSSPVRLLTLKQFTDWWKTPVQFVLLGFGLVNAGVPFAAVGR
jgi:NhaA family Na+:H+ antiporter